MTASSRLVESLLALSLLAALSACGVVSSAADVAGTAVSTTIDVTGKAVGGVIDTVTPDDDDD